MSLNRDSALPLYFQLKEKLKERIARGEYLPGEQVPSENELASKYDVSRNTAKQAIAALVADGVLYRRQGLGTFVAKKKTLSGLTEKLSFSTSYASENGVLTTKVLDASEIEANGHYARKFSIEEGEIIYKINRLRMMDGTPVAIQTSYIPRKYCDKLLEYDFSEKSLFGVLESEYGVVLNYAEEILDCIKANEEEATLLKVDKGAPLFYLNRKTYDLQDRVIEYVRSFMPGYRVRFSFCRGQQAMLQINHDIKE